MFTIQVRFRGAFSHFSHPDHVRIELKGFVHNSASNFTLLLRTNCMSRITCLNFGNEVAVYG
jgi:hypothetical protein